MAGCSLTFLDLLLVCVVWGTWLHCIKGDCGEIRRIKFYQPDNGRYLEGHVFLNRSIGIHRQCEEQCLLESECVSVNIGPPSNEKFICELSNSDHVQHPQDLKLRRDWIYKGIENLCASNPCVNSGKCLMGFTNKKYLCVCKIGFTGENCENDIDECSSSSHTCSEHATCTNTAGHFNCSCKPGYIGDGHLCLVFLECQGALGMANGSITDEQISASSVYNANHAAKQGRLYFQETQIKSGAWAAARNKLNQWLEIDLRDQHTIVTGVATQGRNYNNWPHGPHWQWVRKYKLQYSDDGVTFQYYREKGQSEDKEFVGNTDRDSVVYHELNPAITARYIRFRPTAWDKWIAMRVELYGCKGSYYSSYRS